MIFKMANSNAKLQEGIEHIKEAEKALKTGFFKWKQDFDTAADRYSKAALCFKLAKSFDRSKAAYVEAASAHEKNNSLFHAAKSLSEAASVCSTMGNIDEAVRLMEQACKLYREHGTPDSATFALVKAAKMCESVKPDKSVELLMLAVELCEIDEKFRDASNHLNTIVRIQLKQQKYFEACETVKQFLELNKQTGNYPQVNKAVLILVILYLTLDDSVAADKVFKDGFDYDDFGTSDEASISEKLISAYDDGDADLLKEISKSPVVSMQDTEIAKLGRNLKPSEFSVTLRDKKTDDAPKEDTVNESVPSQGDTSEFTPQNKVTLEDEDLDEGIC